VIHSWTRVIPPPAKPQEELDCFPKGNLPKLSDRLSMFLDGYVQGEVGRENPPRRHEAFQFGRSQGFDRFRIICQPAENLFCYPFGFRFVSEVLLNPPASQVIGKLVHRFSAIDRLIEFDCLTAI